ncbi:MAG: hypothetical protein ACKPKO_19395, partial [Candidatus Fonsibacter sp.]
MYKSALCINFGILGIQQDDGLTVGEACPRPPSDTSTVVFWYLCIVVQAHYRKLIASGVRWAA